MSLLGGPTKYGAVFERTGGMMGDCASISFALQRPSEMRRTFLHVVVMFGDVVVVIC